MTGQLWICISAGLAVVLTIGLAVGRELGQISDDDAPAVLFFGVFVSALWPVAIGIAAITLPGVGIYIAARRATALAMAWKRRRGELRRQRERELMEARRAPMKGGYR